ncbi:unnamed protein product, partial [Ectocarpus sp. 12 AP-2014]
SLFLRKNGHEETAAKRQSTVHGEGGGGGRRIHIAPLTKSFSSLGKYEEPMQLTPTRQPSCEHATANEETKLGTWETKTTFLHKPKQLLITEGNARMLLRYVRESLQPMLGLSQMVVT